MNAREAQALFIIKELLFVLKTFTHDSEVKLGQVNVIDKAQKFADKMEARYKRDAEGYKPK